MDYASIAPASAGDSRAARAETGLANREPRELKK
jgi:hypothetical protein